ncbi:MAG: hypothetical protein J4432_02845 [DPANN group archaeon]|nr:hypothetical protein [DPANN group archaeon]
MEFFRRIFQKKQPVPTESRKYTKAEAIALAEKELESVSFADIDAFKPKIEGAVDRVRESLKQIETAELQKVENKKLRDAVEQSRKNLVNHLTPVLNSVTFPTTQSVKAYVEFCASNTEKMQDFMRKDFKNTAYTSFLLKQHVADLGKNANAFIDLINEMGKALREIDDGNRVFDDILRNSRAINDVTDKIKKSDAWAAELSEKRERSEQLISEKNARAKKIDFEKERNELATIDEQKQAASAVVYSSISGISKALKKFHKVSTLDKSVNASLERYILEPAKAFSNDESDHLRIILESVLKVLDNDQGFIGGKQQEKMRAEVASILSGKLQNIKESLTELDKRQNEIHDKMAPAVQQLMELEKERNAHVRELSDLDRQIQFLEKEKRELAVQLSRHENALGKAIDTLNFKSAS